MGHRHRENWISGIFSPGKRGFKSQRCGNSRIGYFCLETGKGGEWYMTDGIMKEVVGGERRWNKKVRIIQRLIPTVLPFIKN